MRVVLLAVTAASIFLASPSFSQEGTAGGVAAGAAAGAVVGGPVGAIIGAVAGGTIGTAIDPPETAVTYVRQQNVDPVVLEGEVVVGARLPTDAVTLYEIPDYEYRFAYVNERRVLVDPDDGTIVAIID